MNNDYSGSLFIFYLIQRDFQGQLYVLPDRLLRQDYAVALPTDSPLREPINVILLQKIREKAWQDKLKKYLGEWEFYHD